MEILLVTSNVGKAREAIEILKPWGIKVKYASIEMQETKTTLEEIAMEKARQAFAGLKQPLIVEDTGLFFEAFDNFPGPYPKRMFQKYGYGGLMKMLDGKSRRAYFKAVVCYADSSGAIKIFTGVCKGRIASSVSNIKDTTLPFDAIFITDGFNKTNSEITAEEKNSASHRFKALNAFAEFFANSKK